MQFYRTVPVSWQRSECYFICPCLSRAMLRSPEFHYIKAYCQTLAILLICFYKTSILPSTFISAQPITHQVYRPLLWNFVILPTAFFSFFDKFIIFPTLKNRTSDLHYVDYFIFQEHSVTLVTLWQIYEYTLDITDNMSDVNAKKRWMIFSRLISMGVYAVPGGCGPQSCFWMRKWEK